MAHPSDDASADIGPMCHLPTQIPTAPPYEAAWTQGPASPREEPREVATAVPDLVLVTPSALSRLLALAGGRDGALARALAGPLGEHGTFLFQDADPSGRPLVMRLGGHTIALEEIHRHGGRRYLVARLDARQQAALVLRAPRLAGPAADVPVSPRVHAAMRGLLPARIDVQVTFVDD